MMVEKGRRWLGYQIVRLGQAVAGPVVRKGSRVVLLADPLAWGVGVVLEAWTTLLVEWNDPLTDETVLRRYDPFELELEEEWRRRLVASEQDFASLLK